MVWWQIFLIIIMFVIAGLIFGYLLSYVIIAQIMRRPFLKRFAPTVIFKQFKTPAPKKQPPKETRTKQATVLKVQPKLSTEQTSQAEASTTQASISGLEKGVAEESGEGKLIGYALMSEVKNNSKIASRAKSGDLKSFSTKVWESTSPELLNLPEDFRQELNQAYVDMRLANSIVWLAIELKRRSPNLDDNYNKLCENISTRLSSIIPILEKQ